MAEGDGASRLLAAMLDTSNVVATIGGEGQVPGPIRLAREEMGASLTQDPHDADALDADILILSRAQAKALADALAGGATSGTFAAAGGDPQPIMLTMADGLLAVSQKFLENDGTDVVQVRPSDAPALAHAIHAWLREVS